MGASAVAAAPGGVDRDVSLAVARWAGAVRAVGLVLDGDEWRFGSAGRRGDGGRGGVRPGRGRRRAERERTCRCHWWWRGGGERCARWGWCSMRNEQWWSVSGAADVAAVAQVMCHGLGRGVVQGRAVPRQVRCGSGDAEAGVRLRTRGMGASVVAAAPGGADRHVSLSLVVLGGDEWRWMCPSWLMLRGCAGDAPRAGLWRGAGGLHRAPVIARAGRR